MTTIQVRNVSEETSRALKAKAALKGRSLSDYLLRELDRLATRPSRAEPSRRREYRDQDRRRHGTGM